MVRHEPPPGRRPTWIVPAAIAVTAALGGYAALVARPSTAPAPVEGERTATAGVTGSAGDRPAPRRAAGSAAEFAAIDSNRPGVAAYNAGDLPGAVEHFAAAVAANPGNPDALNNLGQVLVRSGRAREAIGHFDAAIAIAPATWAYHFNRARAFAQAQEWGPAIAGYRDAARLFPGDYVTQFNLAHALQASGDPGAAAEAYARAIELAPGEPRFHLSHAAALEAAGRPAEAAAAYRRFLELDPASPDAEKIKGRVEAIERPPAP